MVVHAFQHPFNMLTWHLGINYYIELTNQYTITKIQTILRVIALHNI